MFTFFSEPNGGRLANGKDIEYGNIRRFLPEHARKRCVHPVGLSGSLTAHRHRCGSYAGRSQKAFAQTAKRRLMAGRLRGQKGILHCELFSEQLAKESGHRCTFTVEKRSLKTSNSLIDLPMFPIWSVSPLKPVRIST
jgi:hypothetical protein